MDRILLMQDPFTLTKFFLSEASPLQAVMDASIINGNEIFGWIISTIDKTRLIMGQGLVYGRAPTSYSNECDGLLSLLRFLLQLHLYTKTLTPSFENYTSSQSLIATVSHLSKWTLHIPSTTLQPE